MVVVAGAAFYAGDVYNKGSMPSRGTFAQGTFMRGGTVGAAGVKIGGGVVAGQIISADANSITVKAQDGSTKIVLVGSSAQIMKSALGTIKDLSTGTNVVIAGTANSDGSVTATTVQIRPAGSSNNAPMIRYGGSTSVTQ